MDAGAEVIVHCGDIGSEEVLVEMAAAIHGLTGEDALAFFDAIAPIVYLDSVDLSKAWYQSRYDKPGPGGSGKDYINCPLDKEQYTRLIGELLAAPKTEFKEWEGTPYFEGCLPIEVMAERGFDTLRFGPMKPVGLTDPHTGRRPHAVVQLRQDNALGTLYNLVGFQTKLKHGAQAAIFRTIPGLEGADFARLGGIHRNTFLNSPRLLDGELRLKARADIRFAGQITGCEGYVESAATGLLAGLFAAAEWHGRRIGPPPATSAMGALLHHITAGHVERIEAGPRSFQPMNVNFGLFPPVQLPPPEPGQRRKRKDKASARKLALSARARADYGAWAPLALERARET